MSQVFSEDLIGVGWVPAPLETSANDRLHAFADAKAYASNSCRCSCPNWSTDASTSQCSCAHRTAKPSDHLASLLIATSFAQSTTQSLASNLADDTGSTDCKTSETSGDFANVSSSCCTSPSSGRRCSTSSRGHNGSSASCFVDSHVFRYICSGLRESILPRFSACNVGALLHSKLCRLTQTSTDQVLGSIPPPIGVTTENIKNVDSMLTSIDCSPCHVSSGSMLLLFISCQDVKSIKTSTSNVQCMAFSACHFAESIRGKVVACSLRKLLPGGKNLVRACTESIRSGSAHPECV
mmetsp:Transcript_16755/g.46092  ORF Transcript_16755/g.46092 Transcript_16755/m.46092 type:complete len:295 (+) Transcript_16755:686-1570(+)